MAAQIGQYALILALIIALAQVVMGIAGRFSSLKVPPTFGAAGAGLQLVFISAAVLALLVLPPTAPAQGKGAWLVWTVLTLMTVLAAVVMTLSLSRWTVAEPEAREARPAKKPGERVVLAVALGLATVVVIGASGLVALLEREPEPSGELAASPNDNPGGPVAHSAATPEIMAMVDGLDARLKTDPHDPAGWEMLMRSRVNLGQMELAGAAYHDAMAAYGSDKAQQAEFSQAAASLGISR